MDNKKQQPNFSKQANSKACQSTETNRKSTELHSNKPWTHTRRRENSNASKNDQQRSTKQQSTSVGRSNVDKRPRPRGCNTDVPIRGTSTGDNLFATTSSGLALEDDGDSRDGADYAGAHGTSRKDLNRFDYELCSVYSPGNKKQNLNHLLNFHYAPRDDSMGSNFFDRIETGVRRSGAVNKKHKYNKEQFMQANFQFVIKSNVRPKFISSPDTLVDWHLIEQINIQTTEELQCPICLYPPIAAKMTRCGHAYCWPCILHYLALTDKTWRKCPICYEAIHTVDLKSTTIVQQQAIMVGDQISFQLMRRQKNSMIIEQYKSADLPTLQRYPRLCSTDDASKRFSKFLIANRPDILSIIDREHRELLTDGDSTCPEFIFIQQALDLLKERREKLGNVDSDNSEAYYEDNAHNQITNEVPDPVPANDDNTAKVPDSDALSLAEENGKNSLLKKSTTLPSKCYYFYQSVDGQNIYLHPLNVKMLQACYGTLDQAPLLINSHIIQKEYHSMDEERRRKFTCLAHLPLTCQFAVVEVDLQPPLITEGILKLFKDDILHRKMERERRDREERKRDRKIEEFNDRQMGKLIANTANINFSSSQEFPTCGFDDALVSNNDVETTTASVLPTPNTQVTYSSVATWGKATASTSIKSSQMPSYPSSESDSVKRVALNSDCDADAPNNILSMHTNLGDVLAEALIQKKQSGKTNSGPGACNKKKKKAKKMQPLFSTGMNYNDK